MKAPAQNPKTEVSPLDFSCRFPLLVLFLGAAVWILFASVLGLISSLKFHSPGLLASSAWLTYGRVWPASQSALLYGFCVPAGLGVGLWILVQIGRSPLVQPWLVLIGVFLWNFGVAIGVLGILAGDATGFEYLEMPRYASPFILLGYLLIGLLAVLTFHFRRERLLSPPQWFFFTAIFWFFWIYSTAQLLLVTFPVRGVAQSIIAWWFSTNAEVVWLGLVGLATVFYFLPLLASSESDSYYLELFIYWMFILFASWGGIPLSAPVPAWMPSLSTVATVMTLVPLLTVALVCRQYRVAPSKNGASDPGPLFSFIRFGLRLFILAGLMRIVNALPGIGAIVDYTWFTTATHAFQTYGFFTLVMFAAIYYLIPRLTGTPFPSPGLVRAHLWLLTAGVVFLAAPLAIGGVIQGLRLREPGVAFLDIFNSTLMFLRISTLGDLLLTLGNLLFVVNLLRLIVEFYRVRAEAACAVVTADLFKTAEAKS